CPMKIEHIPFIVNMRRELVEEGEVDKQTQDTLEFLTRYGNSFGKSERMRAAWTKELDFKIKDARKEAVDYLWFVGDYASYDARTQDITRKVSKVFDSANISFGLLYDDERNSGNDVRRIGEEGLYEMLVETNAESVNNCEFKEIITTDPHTYNTLKNEYSQFIEGNGGKLKVKHYTELIWDLIQNGKLKIKRKLNLTVTYHDPCYLGRYNNIYDEPRKILNALGARIVEMERNRESTYCCGAGGGRIWMEDAPGIKERPADNRIREAVALKNVNTFVVSCPKDYVMFEDAVKTTNNEGKIVIKDIAELVFEAMELKMSSKD
ncbi:MAG: (Fe-S)-binding protein, partial [Thermoplasmata archaeon]|nr:(Fe-S)-binding protein [Thermoplasmata archaeon]